MELPRRKPNRLQGYDYSQNGAYFVTICTKNRQNILSDISRGGAFKSRTTKQANRLENRPGRQLWQRSFYDHIIRNGQDFEEIRRYIDENPLKWVEDRLYRQ